MTTAANRPASPRPDDDGAVARDLLAWYDRSRRVLPWRALPGVVADPYAVWLSEIMLQQTTVQAVKPYFAAFLARWPTIDALAAAPVESVMQAWAGLGYYSRARNLHACAQAVVRDCHGRFPDTEAALRDLPGIGAYTAAAIVAIAFGRRATVVDGNVERVMARLRLIDAPPAAAKPRMRAAMGAVTPTDRAGDFAQATMDLGATICTPRNPACAICPLMTFCGACRAGMQRDLPRRALRRATPLRHGLAFYAINEAGAILVRRRPPKGLLGGMIELPGTGWTTVCSEPAVFAGACGRVTHPFTHFTLHLDVVPIAAKEMMQESRDGSWWIDAQALDREALPTLMRNAVAISRSARISTLPDRPPASRTHHRN